MGSRREQAEQAGQAERAGRAGRAGRAERPASARKTSRRWVFAGVVGLGVAVFAACVSDRGRALDGAPCWSPDGKQIAFAVETNNQPADIYLMNSDGSGRRQLTTTSANETTPAFSPDGSRIAFSSDRDGSTEIYVMNADGTNVQRLTQDPANDSSPAWSPDGKRLAFMSDRDMRASTDIYTMSSADGSDLRRLTNDLANWAPQYSPDGRFLALQVDQDVAILEPGVADIRRLTHAPDNGMNPTWAPDGERLAFVTTRNGPGEIFVMNRDGTGQRSVAAIPDANLVDPRWAPTGDRIAFVALPSANPERGGPSKAQGIYVVDLRTGKTEKVSR
jgi:Tol biopolymer transport system component